MAWENTGQQSLADQLVSRHKSLEELDDLNNLIDWSRIEFLLKGVHNSTHGERAFNPVLMFKFPEYVRKPIYTTSVVDAAHPNSGN